MSASTANSTRSNSMSTPKILGLMLLVIVAWEILGEAVLGFFSGVFSAIASILSSTLQTPVWLVVLVTLYVIVTMFGQYRNRKQKD